MRRLLVKENKKYFLIPFLLFAVLFLLSSCSTAAKSEKEIIKDLQASPVFISADVEISDYEIIKRKTDVNNKTDEIYITVHTKAAELTSSLTYELKYERYNEGWILESVMRYWDGPWEFSGLSDEQLLADIKDSDYYFSNWELNVENVEIIEESCNSNAMVYYEKQIVVSLTAHNTLFDYNSTYNMYYGVVDGAWELQSEEIWNRSYTPTYSPDIVATDSIMESLELGSGASATSYDSYKYVRTETDWENCAETRYYTATKNWWFGTETYLVSIPLKFSLENGEGSSNWTYSSNAIKSSLQNVDWNVEGSWNAGGSSYNVGLSIFNILPTQDSNVFSVLLRCDAYHRDPYWDWNYHCDARDVRATMRQTAPGIYRLDIENPSEDTNNKWEGTFWIWGQDQWDNPSGLYWQWGWKGISSNPDVVSLEMNHTEKEQIEQATQNVISAAKEKGLDIITYDEDNPIYGVWKVIHPTGLTEIFCFCPDGTVVYTHLILLSSPIDSTYTYSDTTLALWETKWSLNWETPDFFNMTALDDPDNFWPSFSRIPL